MAKARGEIQNWTVTIGGIEGVFQVDADSREAAIEKVKKENEHVAKRDSRNFVAIPTASAISRSPNVPTLTGPKQPTT